MLMAKPLASIASPGAERGLGTNPKLAVQAAKKLLRLSVRSRLEGIPRELILSQSANVCQALVAHPAFKAAKRVSIFVSMPTGEIDTTSLIVTALEMKKQVFVPYIHRAGLVGSPAPTPAATPSTPTSTPERSAGPAAAARSAKKAATQPVMDMLQIYSIQDLRELQPDKWGIPSIDPSTVGARHNCFGGVGINRHRLRDFPEAGIDLMVMPGLAFDRDLNRLGHGKGYYDRFLSRFPAERLKKPFLVGIALSEQMVVEEEQIPIEPWDEQIDELVLGDGSVISKRDAGREGRGW